MTTSATLLTRRKTLLQQQGGLPQPQVNNQERLYLLEEETRNSIMIEGYFSTKKELKQVIEGTQNNSKHSDKIMGYFDAASLIYEYAYQKHQESATITLEKYDIKTIHSLMFKEVSPTISGKRRNGDMMISGATIQPLVGGLVDQGISYLLKYLTQKQETLSLIQLLARFHVLFEATHPFEDGNGRVGRILINYLLVSQGYPNIIIKGTQTAKKAYFTAFEQGEQGLYTTYPSQLPSDDWDTVGDFSNMENIIYSNLFESLDRLILSNNATLEPLTSIVERKGFSKSYARQLVQRGKVIAKKIGNTRHSHEEYFYQ